MPVLFDFAALLGRILLSGIFLLSGVNKLLHWNQTAEHMQAEGMPMVPLLLIAAVLIELGAGLCLLLGYWTRFAALILIGFLLPAALIFHDFWRYADPAAVQNQMQHFMKNVTIMGGLFMVVAHGPGRLSADSRRARKIQH